MTSSRLIQAVAGPMHIYGQAVLPNGNSERARAKSHAKGGEARPGANEQAYLGLLRDPVIGRREGKTDSSILKSPEPTP